jgi:RimJ/RimL family protein N-acetyltransferase
MYWIGIPGISTEMQNSIVEAFDTQRLYLRPLGDADESLYCRLYTDPVLMQHIAAPMTPEAAQRSFGVALKQQGGARMVWVISERDGGAERGILGVVPKDESTEVGVMLFADGQARGLAVEVIAAIADFLFQSTAILRLWTRHSSANGPASVLMRKLGFEPLTTDGMPTGELRWQMTRKRWHQLGEVAVADAESSR